uniref:ATP synthase F0 subunit 8 n=1 Tax=Actenodia billbergi TaxID=444481 RepID=UPI001FA81125|nr:ATP synthase F0 subunit 8 [Actenodia billbergi]UMR54785.1 ATP synthase F0 subunit 8 [Actenodia billbergi]
MPQMAPLNWLTLMVYFILIFLTLNSFNFYTFICYKKTSISHKPNITKTNWKWL